MVVVVGDVNSTLACSIVAAKSGLLVAHVEAGLRSRDWAMPEEVNRVVTDRVSDYLFAPSADAVDNLRAEGYRDDQIHLVGNVMVDTLLRNVERARERGLPPQLALKPQGYTLLTLHRPSNVDDPATLARLLGALGEVARDIPIVFPAHPRTRERMAELTVAPGIVITEPLGYLDFLALQSEAALVLTDSGGIQEETTALGVPCLTLRETTERPITVSEGTNRLVGTDPAAIIDGARAVLRGEVVPRCPALWDGAAAPRIARGSSSRAEPRRRSAAADRSTRPTVLRSPVRVLFDIVHPAHVHFFKYLYADLVAGRARDARDRPGEGRHARAARRSTTSRTRASGSRGARAGSVRRGELVERDLTLYKAARDLPSRLRLDAQPRGRAGGAPVARSNRRVRHRRRSRPPASTSASRRRSPTSSRPPTA